MSNGRRSQPTLASVGAPASYEHPSFRPTWDEEPRMVWAPRPPVAMSSAPLSFVSEPPAAPRRGRRIWLLLITLLIATVGTVTYLALRRGEDPIAYVEPVARAVVTALDPPPPPFTPGASSSASASAAAPASASASASAVASASVPEPAPAFTATDMAASASPSSPPPRKRARRKLRRHAE